MSIYCQLVIVLTGTDPSQRYQGPSSLASSMPFISSFIKARRRPFSFFAVLESIAKKEDIDKCARWGGGINEVFDSPLYSLDDLELRNEAETSPKTFLSKLTLPCVLDEVQKAPELFDALKLKIDKKEFPDSTF